MYYILMIMIVYGYTPDSKRSMANPDRSELVPTYLCKNPKRSSQKERVPDLIFYYHLRCYDSPGFSTHNVFIGDFYDVPG